MFKKYLPNCTLIGLMVLAFLIRFHVFFRVKDDPTALDIYNILQIVITLLLALILLFRRDFPFVLRLIIRSPVGWLVVLYFFGMLSGLWSAIPMFSSYFGLEGLVYILAFAVILLQQPDDNGLEKLVVNFSFLLIALHIIGLLRIMGFSFSLSHWHSNAYPAIASMLFAYSLGEYYNKYRVKSAIEKKMLKLVIWISLFFVFIGTSSGSNFSTASAILMVIIISGKKSSKIIAIFLFITLLVIDQVNLEKLYEFAFPQNQDSSLENFGVRMVIGKTI